MQDPSGATVLAGKYKLVHQLGKGGMGSVWLAQHLTLHSPVAIKLIDAQIANHPEALARFMREARAAAALRSPHVVQILDHGVDNGTPYIAMEVLEGESLATRLRKVGRLSPENTARILTHTGRAVARAHEAGVVHRDLKPDNIFLIENEEEELAKVLDFGIAKSTVVGFGMSAVADTRTGALMGTLHYMSPEQTEGVKSVDFRTDIWAMGVIAFECLVGRRPFEGEAVGALVLEICSRPLPVPSRMGAVPAGFDAWFARACARLPADRFPSAREAAADLRRICQARGFASDDREVGRALPAEGARTEVTAPSGRRAVGLLVGVGVAVAAIVAVAVVLTRPGSQPPAAVAVPAVQPAASAAAPAPVPIVAAPPAPEPVPVPAKSAEPSAPPPEVPTAPKSSATARPHHRADKTAPKQAQRPSAPEPAKPAPATPEKPKVNLGF
jgi:serine/threonine-protein kinase